VQAAETGMAVLKGLAHLGGRSSLTALSTHVGESPAKVHRYLASLMEEGLVLQDAGSQHYYLGTEAIQIGLAAMRQADPIRAAEPCLIRLRESLEVTCFVAVMGNKGPTIVRFEEPGLPVTVNVRAGSVMSMLWSATGRAFLGCSTSRACWRWPSRNWATPRPTCARSSTRKTRSVNCAARCARRAAPA
jgi:DNA-binding IclR family transcriptional regulator